MTTSLPIFAIGMPSGMEWIWILMILLLLFGGAKLPALAKGLGQSIKEFKKSAKEGDDDEKSDKKPDANQKPGNN